MLNNEVMEKFFLELETKEEQDKLVFLREFYDIPSEEGKPKIYFAGNSLGLQPKSVSEYIKKELEIWKKFGVEGHFQGDINWFNFHSQFDDAICKLIGAEKDEVVVANALTVNLHLLFSTFYKPTRTKYKILIESPSFSSDYHAVCSQIESHGLNVSECLIEVKPRIGEFVIRTEDIISKIEEYKNELALVWIGAVNFYSGQVFDLQTITRKAHEVNAKSGFDLAHAIGNIPLNLHEQKVDFATWCSYKYLNSGPGGVSGLFIHNQNHHYSPAFKGWWGVDEYERFKMGKEFMPMKGAKAWQLSNAPVLSMAVHKAALDEFAKVDFNALRKKSIELSGALIEGLNLIVKAFPDCDLQIITPLDSENRGAQVSIYAHKKGKLLFDYLKSKNVVADWREPNVIRMAPVPMYNTFEEVSKTVALIYGYFDRN